MDSEEGGGRPTMPVCGRVNKCAFHGDTVKSPHPTVGNKVVSKPSPMKEIDEHGSKSALSNEARFGTGYNKFLNSFNTSELSEMRRAGRDSRDFITPNTLSRYFSI
jgi:hypothetical protein